MSNYKEERDLALAKHFQELPIQIYTDGSCPKNPGGDGGYGAVLLTEPPIEISGHIPAPTTNNRAEIMAIIVSIFKARTLGYHNLEVYSDSEYCLKILKGENRAKKNKDLWYMCRLATDGAKISYFWVKGHSNDLYNELADKLASKGTLKTN